ncbi:MAG: hypothetical protein IPH28_25375 [Cytophagaceae bacterium]|nr:hypothetical protein [Cytophagaceae bacterium]
MSEIKVFCKIIKAVVLKIESFFQYQFSKIIKIKPIDKNMAGKNNADLPKHKN